MTQILIAYGSKRRGTAGLAVMIGEALAEAGFDTVVAAAGDVGDLAGFDAVIVAGALYANRWHRHARRFVRRHAAALRGLPVWLVSSGPLDESAARGDIPPTRQAARCAELVGARGHVTFGGMLAPDARGFPARAMAKTRAGDWRDRAHVGRWVNTTVVPVLSSGGTPEPGPRYGCTSPRSLGPTSLSDPPRPGDS